jgi:hypothetical protein
MRDSAVATSIVVVPVFVAIIGAIVAAYAAWTLAPPVAGGWYPYVRAAVALVAAIVGSRIGTYLGALVVMAGAVLFGP